MKGYQFTKAYSSWGADMGRCENLSDALAVKKVRLQMVPLDSGGYDPGGAYWGSGPRLYVAWGDGTEEVQEIFMRARDREEAKDEVQSVFKNAKFYR